MSYLQKLMMPKNILTWNRTQAGKTPASFIFSCCTNLSKKADSEVFLNLFSAQNFFENFWFPINPSINQKNFIRNRQFFSRLLNSINAFTKYLFFLLFTTHFPSVGLSASHVRSDWLPMVVARQRSGLAVGFFKSVTFKEKLNCLMILSWIIFTSSVLAPTQSCTA